MAGVAQRNGLLGFWNNSPRLTLEAAPIAARLPILVVSPP